MKNRFSRILSACLTLSLCLGLFLTPVRAEAFIQALNLDDAVFTLTADQVVQGGALTVTAKGLDEKDSWSFNLHISKGGIDLYSLVGPKGQGEFLLLSDSAKLLPDALLWGDASRTFLLTVPEEYRDWSIALRVSTKDRFGEIVLPLSGSAVPVTVSFDDVPKDAWYRSYVTTICGRGWMSGVSRDQFDPEGQMTVAQVLVLAARLYSDRRGGVIPTAPGAWFMAYFNYCLTNGIISRDRFSLADMDRPATRFELVSILDQAADPARTQDALNQVSDGFIPDLAEADPYGAVVYRWYRSGILTGDAQHRFHGAANIKRSEVSVILCQLLYLVDRVKL